MIQIISIDVEFSLSCAEATKIADAATHTCLYLLHVYVVYIVIMNPNNIKEMELRSLKQELNRPRVKTSVAIQK